MKSKLTNGMKSILTTTKDVMGVPEGFYFISLEILWEMNVFFEPGKMTVEPGQITQAILKVNEADAAQVVPMDLKDWTMEFYRLEEREVPYEFEIIQVELFPDERKLIAAI